MTKRTAKRIAVNDLRAGSIESTPINADMSEAFRNYYDGEEGNQFWEPSQCEECGKVLVLHMGGGGEMHKDLDSESECEGHVPTAEGPMMNYWYPVDNWQVDQLGGPEAATERIEGCNMALVQFDDQYGVALTGGGMDFSWEICETYTKLGLLPPVHFCGLPAMAGRGESAHDKYIMAACRKSLTVLMTWTKGKLRDLRSLSVKAAR